MIYTTYACVDIYIYLNTPDTPGFTPSPFQGSFSPEGSSPGNHNFRLGFAKLRVLELSGSLV